MSVAAIDDLLAYLELLPRLEEKVLVPAAVAAEAGPTLWVGNQCQPASVAGRVLNVVE